MMTSTTWRHTWTPSDEKALWNCEWAKCFHGSLVDAFGRFLCVACRCFKVPWQSAALIPLQLRLNNTDKLAAGVYCTHSCYDVSRPSRIMSQLHHPVLLSMCYLPIGHSLCKSTGCKESVVFIERKWRPWLGWKYRGIDRIT